jgi:hypothetical protein
MMVLGGYTVSRIEAVAQVAADMATQPLILEKDDGEHPVRRSREAPMPTAEFTIKVDPKNGGSRHLERFAFRCIPTDQISFDTWLRNLHP